MNARQRRQITMLTLVLALGVAIYLNWEYAKNDPTLITQPTSSTSDFIPVDNNTSDVDEQHTQTDEPKQVSDMLQQETEDGNKNYGDAQLVSASSSKADEYFEKAEMSRKKTRDEALDTLQKSLKNAKLTSEEKKNLTNELTALLTGITAEGDIENMVLAKGFENCITSITDDKVNVAIRTTGQELSKEKVAQIRDIVTSKIETEANNITIVEVK